jgi:hypothetical protein
MSGGEPGEPAEPEPSRTAYLFRPAGGFSVTESIPMSQSCIAPRSEKTERTSPRIHSASTRTSHSRSVSTLNEPEQSYMELFHGLTSGILKSMGRRRPSDTAKNRLHDPVHMASRGVIRAHPGMPDNKRASFVTGPAHIGIQGDTAEVRHTGVFDSSLPSTPS